MKLIFICNYKKPFCLYFRMNVIKFWQQTSSLIRLVNHFISFPNSKNFRLFPTLRKMRAFSRPNTSFYCYKGDNFTVDHWGGNKSQSNSWNKVYLRIIIFQGSLNKSRFFVFNDVSIAFATSLPKSYPWLHIKCLSHNTMR